MTNLEASIAKCLIAMIPYMGQRALAGELNNPRNPTFFGRTVSSATARAYRNAIATQLLG